ncbi:hypothetical protein DFR29_13220 [Tahibacter aquaticus]|uniref:Uncharacterized protein n=2 Tax=Tahibacter aquaticus TaxID=520092 RepID=A0A4R6YHD2_9GAMM|nr:hypothetical protein DFR29_13220 [Tahibacter aquaticus]
MHMRTLCSALLVLVWLEASAASTETCTAELKGEIRFELVHEKVGERYSRVSEMRMTFLSSVPRTLRHSIDGTKTNWYVRALDPGDEPVTDDNREVPQLSITRFNPKQKPPHIEPAMPAKHGRVVRKGEILTETLRWDDFLIRTPDGKVWNGWKADTRYLVAFRPTFGLDELQGSHSLISDLVRKNCLLGNVLVTTD